MPKTDQTINPSKPKAPDPKFWEPQVDGEAQYVAGKSEQVDGPPQVGQRVSGMFWGASQGFSAQCAGARDLQQQFDTPTLNPKP